MPSLALDLGCGRYCRGDVGLDIDFSWSNPYHDPRQYDSIVGGRRELCDLVLADANYPLPFRDGCFDKVLIVHVLEHLLSPYHTLLEVRRVLRRSGRVVIVAPNARTNNADWLDDSHIYSFTQPSLSRLVSKVFRVVRCELIVDGLDILVEAIKE